MLRIVKFCETVNKFWQNFENELLYEGGEGGGSSRPFGSWGAPKTARGLLNGVRDSVLFNHAGISQTLRVGGGGGEKYKIWRARGGGGTII